MNLEKDPHFLAARDLVSTLHTAGYIAYFAGGWVRDFLLGHAADDIDIASQATPEGVMQLFPHTIAVGAAFGVVLVVHRGYSFEVSSFRTDGLYLYGRRPETVQYSTPEEDAERRDLTVNGMFYDPLTHTVIDYVRGEEDLRRGIIRAIGDPDARIQEDRLRMLRAIRMMARFDFIMDEATEQAIRRYAGTLLPAVAIERVWQELQKMASYPGMARGILELHAVGLLTHIFPQLTSTPRADIELAVGGFSNYPPKTPAILYIAQFFLHLSPQELERFFREDLKVSHAEIHLLLYYLRARTLYTNPTSASSRTEWVAIYAHKDAERCRQVYAASESSEEHRDSFLAFHESQTEQLAPHILRHQQRRTLLRASDLFSLGQQEGPFLGLLLRESERLAIEKDLQDPASALAALQKTPLWQKRNTP